MSNMLRSKKKYLVILLASIIAFLNTLSAQTYQWAKKMGGGSVDEGSWCTVDTNGNVYTVGSFYGSVDFNPGLGSSYLTSAGTTDIFVCKLDSNGNFLWAKGMGGIGYDDASSIDVDLEGNVYITGGFIGTADFDPGPSTFNLTSAGSVDIFVSKLDVGGNFLWAKKIGGVGFDDSRSIALDTNGNVFVGGAFENTVDFDPGAAIYNLTSTGLEDVYIAKFNNDGDFLWAKAFNGTNHNYCNNITTDITGNVYATGYFEATVDFDPGVGNYNLTSAGGKDIFISKLDTAGNFIWAKKTGGPSVSDYGQSIAVDNVGNVYTTGMFQGIADFNPGAGTYYLTTTGDFNAWDIFVSKLDVNGNFVWTVGMGGANMDYPNSIALDAIGNVYTTGIFQDTADFDPGVGYLNLISGGDKDVFISKLNNSGNFQWAKKITGVDAEETNCISINGGGDGIYITGRFWDTVNFNSPDTANLTALGFSDIFIAKYGNCNNTSYSTLSITECNNYTSPSGYYTWTHSGIYNDVIPNISGCDSIITVLLTINTVDTSITQTTTSLSANAIGAMYQWLDCNNSFAPIISEANQVYTPLSGGTFAVEVTENGCTDTSSCYNFIIAGIQENILIENFEIHPNPFIDEIIFASLPADTKISISNVFGELVGKYVIYNSHNSCNVSQLPAGIYFITISYNNVQFIKKVIKQ